MEQLVYRFLGRQLVRLLRLLRSSHWRYLPMSAEPRSRPKGMDFARLAERDGSEEKCREYIGAMRWPGGPRCPRCGKKLTKIAGKGSRSEERRVGKEGR